MLTWGLQAFYKNETEDAAKDVSQTRLTYG